VFSDSAAAPPSGGWWQEAAARLDAETLTAGTYRTTGSGGAGAVNPMPPTSMNAAFVGVADPNGTWTLRLTDACAGDPGSITAASLTVNSAPSGAVHVDFDGDRKTDWSVARQTGDDILWFNENAAGFSATQWGLAATDFLVPADYDGDGKTDIAIWRPGAQAVFYIRQSSNDQLRVVNWGVTGDDAAIAADYDGDGKADPAIYRCPAIGSGDGQCYFWVLGSTAGTMVMPWGFGEQFDFFVSPGDFDGDGKADFCIQRTNPASAGSGQFVLRRSSDGGVEYINWGRNSDIIVPGDYDGDGKSDFMVSRTETIGGTPGRSYYLLTRTGGGTGGSPIRFGIVGDVRTPGDYDGDGKMDVAIWRSSVTPGQSAFWVLKSSGGLIHKPFGASGDYATASWNVH
jgi:hypothetical protein